MRRNRAHPEEKHERWLVSYADFITLLFAFFVVMFASSEVNKKRVGELSSVYTSYLRGGEPAPPAPAGSEFSAEGPEGEEDLATAEIITLEQRVEERLIGPIERGELTLRRMPRGLVLSLREATFFDSGQDTLKPDARRLLAQIGSVIAEVSHQPIRLEGHTDNTPIHTSRFPSNWELSAARAVATLGVLTAEGGIAPERISVSGYGEERPLESNDRQEGRSANRRVNVVILSQSAAAMAPKQRVAGLPAGELNVGTEERPSPFRETEPRVPD